MQEKEITIWKAQSWFETLNKHTPVCLARVEISQNNKAFALKSA